MNKLVNYSSSESSDDDESNSQKDQVKIKLPVPFQKAVDNNSEYNNKELHQGRNRTIKHEAGNWASHIYIDYPMDGEQGDIIKLLQQNIVAKFPDLQTIEYPHISLSKTFILKFHWIDNFIRSLREFIGQIPKNSSFELKLSPELRFYTNEDKTRSFVCILCNPCCDSDLLNITSKVDNCLKEYKLPVYYTDPSFHASILWKLKEFTNEEKQQLSLYAEELLNNLSSHLINVDKILCKSGNKIFNISLT
ncbi:unnamed protein product [Diamesa hyperborea]